MLILFLFYFFFFGGGGGVTSLSVIFTMEKALFKIFWYKLFTSKQIFKSFAKRFRNSGMQKVDNNHIFLQVFHKSVILKKAFSKDDVRTVNITCIFIQWNKAFIICT